MSLASTTSAPFRPPAPKPREAPIGALAMVYALWRNPLEVWTRAHFELPILIGSTVLGVRAVVNDPAAVKRILLDNAANYRKDALQLRVLRPGLGTGLLTAEGEDWRAQRRALAPLFSPRQVADFAPAMHRVARAAAARYAAAPKGCVSDVAADMARVTLEVLEQTLFSQGLARDPEAFQRAVTRYFETFGRLDPLDLLGAPSFLPRFWRLRGRATLRFFEKAVDDIVGARKTLIASGARPPNDLLTLLLRAQDPETGRAISERDVRANIVTFIGAGHETTANALTWTLYLLSQSPQWRARVEAEIDAAFDPQSSADLGETLPVVKAVLEEALRLYPPAAFLSREAIAEDWLAGVRVPAGTVVTVAPFVLHRHRRLWRDPDVFDPERFLGKNRESVDRYAYIPFGAGPRVCIGMNFAMQEAVIVLAHLLRNLRFDLAPDHVVAPIQRVTLRSRFGMKMIVRRRAT
ncbi:MAG: cytochrome P450 [Roseiarcus sp.]|jgi:cytochrome P450